MSVCIAYSGSTYPNPTKNALVQQVQFHPRQGRSTQTIRCLYEFVPPASSGAHWPVLHLSMPLDFPSHDFASSHAARYFVLMASSCPSLAPLHKPTFPFSLRDSRRCHSRRFKNFVAKCVHANSLNEIIWHNSASKIQCFMPHVVSVATAKRNQLSALCEGGEAIRNTPHFRPSFLAKSITLSRSAGL